MNPIPPRPHRRSRALAALGLAALALAARAQDAPPVSAQTVEARPIVRELRVNGTVTAPRAAVLSTSVGGLIQSFEVDEGDAVGQGDRLVTLDPELDAIALEGARAAEAAALAEMNDARRRLDEAQRLRQERGISESEVRSRAAEAERSEAAHQAAVAVRHRHEAILRRHEIRAPFDGVISRRLAELGEWIGPGDEVLELVAMEGLRFDFRVAQEFFPVLSVGVPVALSVDALPGETLPGHVQAIVPVSDPGARTFLLRAVTDAAAALTPGMSARGLLRLDTGRRGVVVPRDALLRYPDGRTTVWVVDRSGDRPTVSERRVETGLDSAGVIEIRSGLEAGAEVVTRGNESLQDGQAVTLR